WNVAELQEVALLPNPTQTYVPFWDAITGLYQRVKASNIVAAAGGVGEVPPDGRWFARQFGAWQPVRERLSAARTYFVNFNTGNDANDGLTSGTPFKTIQKAIDVAAALDSSIYDVTIQLAGAMTHSIGGGLIGKSMVGAGAIIILGDE